MKALLLSAYDAVSHQKWRKSLVENLPDIDWQELVLPARYFSWRFRGNSLSFSHEYADQLNQSYDFILATSMTDLASLKGLVPSLHQSPCLLYFHENQFYYPDNQSHHGVADIQLTSIYSALAADYLVFNSEFNRTTFLTGVSEFLKKMPDHVPRGIDASFEKKSQVIPVPVDVEKTSTHRKSSGQLQILWNHRWEYDKAPERLLNALKQVKGEFQLHLVGQQFRHSPKVMSEFKTALTDDRISTFGYLDLGSYQQLLSQCHLVVSTSLHDFQGLAILEASMAGCSPLVPDRLAYREIFSESFRYESFVNDEEKEAGILAEQIDERIVQFNCHGKLPVPNNLDRFKAENLVSKYRDLFNLVGGEH